MHPTRSTLLAILLLAGLTGTTLGVEGDWITDPDAALRAASASKRPILAVAMDHG